MSQILVQKKELPQLVQRAVDILRTTKVRRIEVVYKDNDGGFCAVGAIRHGFGIYDDNGKFIPGTGEYENCDSAIQQCDRILRGQHQSIVVLNDSEHWSFNQIADRIEQVYQEIP